MSLGSMSTPLLEVRDLHVSYTGGTRGIRKGRRQIRAVRGVSFEVHRGSVVGLVGESASGKSTVGRAILQLVQPTKGSVHFKGERITGTRGRKLLPFRRDVQVVFQNPFTSLNPAMTVGRIVGEALDIGGMRRSLREQRGVHREQIIETLGLVRLDPEMIDRYPHEFSGGQRQRIAIARAIAAKPSLIVCDEAVSALDVSTQAHIVELLLDIQRQTGVAYLFISHDLSIVRYMSNHIMVMRGGRIVEQGPSERLYTSPAHPYSASLISAVPNPRRKRLGIFHGHSVRFNSETVRDISERNFAANTLIDNEKTENGCPFRHQCKWAFDACLIMPDHTPVSSGGTVACHMQTFGPQLAGRTLTALDPDGVSSAGEQS